MDLVSKNDFNIKTVIVSENIYLMNELDSSINISFENKEESLFIQCDAEQLNRIYIIKNLGLKLESF